MQGEAAAASIIEALDAIYACAGFFDAVVIIRGGGATTDMLAFDEYDLAAHCAQFPLPVITGIGHDRDESIVDMVAHTRCKTPTAVAAFLIDKMAETEADLLSLQNKILNNVSGYLATERNYLNRIAGAIMQKPVWVLQRERQTVKERERKMELLTRNLSDKEQYKMKLYEKTLSLVSPANILKKGYSLTAKNGKTVRSINELETGDVITTILPDGKKQSVVN